jgi:sialic acid synthase SpsE
MNNLIINNVEINNESPTYIIAEIGINHNGDMNNVFKLIDIASDAGCNAVKFQKRTPEMAVPESEWDIRRETPWGEMSYIDYKRKIELTIPQYKEIDRYCKAKQISWFASCWDEQSVDQLAEIEISCFKIASASLTDFKTIDCMLKYDIPIIMSTGMSTLLEIKQSVDKFNDRTIGLLHATSSYPCPPEELNLNMIKTLNKEFPNHIIGYSGHETGLATTSVAVAFGAKIIERHITLDRAMWGTDQSASLAPGGLRSLVGHIRTIEKAFGDGVKKVYESELLSKKKLRREI